MSGQKQDDWKEGLLVEYAILETDKKAMERRFDEDAELNKLRDELRIVLDRIEEAEKPSRASIEAIKQQQAGIKQQLVEDWGTNDDKTYECDAGTATLRTTKSLNIRSKEKLIDFLVLNKKLVDFIKTFEITKLRKIKDAGMLGDDIATYDEKKLIAIKLTEAEQ